MHKHFIFLLVTLIFSVSCSQQKEAEEAIRIEIPNAQTLLAKELDEKGIPYKIDMQNRILYPVSYKDQINNISSRISAELAPVTSAVFNDLQFLNIAKKKFTENGISYTLEASEFGTFINWDKENSVKGSIIINKIFDIQENAL